MSQNHEYLYNPKKYKPPDFKKLDEPNSIVKSIRRNFMVDYVRERPTRLCLHAKLPSKCPCSANYLPELHSLLCSRCGIELKEPYNCEENRIHFIRCSQLFQERAQLIISRFKICDLCGCKPLEQKDPRFGLLSHCSHCFCYKCIETWWVAEPISSESVICPICNVVSDNLCPHNIWIEKSRDKIPIFEQYCKQNKVAESNSHMQRYC